MFVLFLGNLQCLKAQNPFWTFPEQGLDVPDLGINPLPTDDYTGQEADFVHAGLKDPYGEIMFFMMDGRLYNKNGTERAEFDNGVDLIQGGSEALIVPQPGSCNRFYIFQAEPTGIQEADLPHFSVYDDTLNTLLEFFSGGFFKTSRDLINDVPFLEDDWNEGDHGVEGVHFAATREFRDSTRWVFIANNNAVFRVDLTCNGLVDPDWKYDLLPGNDDFVENGWRSEFELFEDTAEERFRFAAPHFDVNAPGGDINVAIFDVDSASGSVIPGSRFNISIENGPENSRSYVHGLEFSPNGKLLYIIHDPTPNYPSPLSYYDFTTSTLTNLNYSDISNFANSQIQLAGDTSNYALYFASNNYLGTLSDPDNPTPSGTGWNPTAIPLSGGYSTNLGGQPSTASQNIKRIIPDQIDFMDYDSVFLKASCDCCYKYAYSGEKQDTSEFVYNTEAWFPGPGNNPWNAAATDTIFIRDSIFVAKGSNLEIRDLNFRFAREAVVVVERGDEVFPGGILTLTDSTHLSADFRCSQLDYVCRDSIKNACDSLIFWQGIRVEGYDDEDQALTGSRQARLNMNKGCTIEFAQVGILAGHEKFDGYGGGIVRIIDSKIKDCPISMRFEGYVALDGSSNEIYNLAGIQNMNFTWTADLNKFEFVSPGIHVDIIRSSGIRLRGNTYQNEGWTFYGTKDRGIGINALDSRVWERWLCDENPPATPCQSPEVRSEFLNLSIGINASSTGSTRTLDAGYGIYENNQVGIQATGLEDPLILDNDFFVPNLDNAGGVYLINSTGYAVENNYFTSMFTSPVNYNLGIRVRSSGPENNEIYNNLFETITIGIVSEEQNAGCVPVYQDGLRWICNRFDPQVPYADIFVYSGNVSDDQGECAPFGEPASNIFSHTSTPLSAHDIRVRPFDLLLCDSVEFDIEYTYHTITGSNPLVLRLEPLTYTNDFVDPDMCTSDFPSQSDCPVINSAAPPGKGSEGGAKSSDESGSETPSFEDFLAMIQAFYEENTGQGSSLVNSFEASSGNWRLEESRLWHRLIRAAQWDTSGLYPKESLWELLSQYQPDAAAGRFASALAQDLNYAVPAWVSAEKDHSSEADISGLSVLASMNFPQEVDPWVTPSFFNHSSNTSQLVELYHEKRREIYLEPLDIDDDLPQSYEDDGAKSGSQEDETRNKISIRPNPFNGAFIMDLKKAPEFEMIRVEIHDLLGRLVLNETYGSMPFVMIDGSEFSTGILIYTVYLDGVKYQTGKLVKKE